MMSTCCKDNHFFTKQIHPQDYYLDVHPILSQNHIKTYIFCKKNIFVEIIVEMYLFFNNFVVSK